MRVAIDGLFLGKEINGVPRYAREIVQGLDELAEPGEFTLLVPGGCTVKHPLHLKNIAQKMVGQKSGQLWEQLELPRELNRGRFDCELYLCNSMPFLSKRGVAVVHDVAPIAHPEFYSRLSGTYSRLMIRSIIERAKCLITVSHFSQAEIRRLFPKRHNAINVVGNAWQHMLRVKEDSQALSRFCLEPKSYCFSLSSLTKNKNLKWIVETAQLNPDYEFVVAGGIDTRVFGQVDIPDSVPNVRYIGYVTDEEAKALMCSCKCFLFPTYYEGFGIPPMEALACGARIIVSDTAVMHEIYGKAAGYIDPDIPCADIEAKIREGNQSARSDVLGAYSWAESAKKLYSIMRNMGSE